ncbi:MAG: hypothetical protein OIF35_04290 [Cellvibrionaceae bacterium]|nr:hypothetical protein [Cellvibrionaceae bacterium]
MSSKQEEGKQLSRRSMLKGMTAFGLAAVGANSVIYSDKAVAQGTTGAPGTTTAAPQQVPTMSTAGLAGMAAVIGTTAAVMESKRKNR